MALKKLSVTDPDKTLMIKIVSAFVALGVNPQAKSSSWLARRLKNHLQAFGFVGASASGGSRPATGQQEPMVEPKAKATKKAAKKESAENRVVIANRALVLYPRVTKQPHPCGLVSHDRASLYKWLVDLGVHPNIITGGAIRKLEDLILTTIPYHCSKEEKSIWLDRGLTIRRQTGKPWMVLLTSRPRLGRELAARNRKPPDFFWPIGPITCFRSRPCISLQIRSKLEPENGRIVRAGC